MSNAIGIMYLVTQQYGSADQVSLSINRAITMHTVGWTWINFEWEKRN